MNLLIFLTIPLTVSSWGFNFSFGNPRAVNVQDIVMKATLLMSKVKGMQNFGEIMNLVSRLNKVNTAQFSFLSDTQGKGDTELIDIINKINNLVTQMCKMSDVEMARGKGFGALVLASNELNTYLKKNQPAWMNFIPDFDFTNPAKGVDDINAVIPDMDMSFGPKVPMFGGGSSSMPGGFNMPYFG